MKTLRPINRKKGKATNPNNIFFSKKKKELIGWDSNHVQVIPAYKVYQLQIFFIVVIIIIVIIVIIIIIIVIIIIL